jgi:hypothetical protein
LFSQLDVLARGTSVPQHRRGQAPRKTTLSQTDVEWEEKWGKGKKPVEREAQRKGERGCKKEITYRKGTVQEKLMVRISKIHLAFSNIYFCQFKVVTSLRLPATSKPLLILFPVLSLFFFFFSCFAVVCKRWVAF